MTRHTKRTAVARHVLSTVAAVLGLLVLVVGIGIYVGHLKAEPVLSGSMRPVAQPGDLVFVKSTPTASLHVGEVIAFYPPGIKGQAPYMHRIVTLSRVGTATTITTKGDANNVADPWGKVTLKDTSTDRLVYVVPKLGFVSVWMHNIVHNGRSLTLVLGGCIVIFATILFGPAVMFRKGHHVGDDQPVRQKEGVSS